MHQHITTLVSLQEVLLELDEVRRNLNKVPNQLQEINDQQDRAKQELDALAQEIEDLDAEIARLKTENQEESERVANYDKRLKTLKTNREYQALLREIGFSRKLVAETEVEMKEKGETRKELSDKVGELEALVEELEESKGSMNDEWNQSQKELGKKETELESKQKLIEKEIARDLMGRYGLVRKRHSKAIVPVENTRCTGCNMAIPPQQYNRLLRGAEVITCNACSRILYVPQKADEEDEQAV